jgi:CheY-like chemotaxis protein
VNGQAAIAAYQTWHPHLIWMDMRMPVMDGYEATQKIRALERQQKEQRPITIIALTASAFEEERAAVIASGCDDFVRKPFHTHVIFEKMAKHLGVRYLYKNSPEEPTPPTAAPLKSEDLTVMSAAWLVQFHQAAVQVDAEQLHQLIEKIPANYSQMAAALSTFTHNFCFDELIALAKTAIEQNTLITSAPTETAPTETALIETTPTETDV